MRGRPRSSTRIFVEDLSELGIRDLPRPLPTRDLENHPDEPWIGVNATWRDGRESFIRLRLTTTKPHYGGFRHWFLCPHCDSRVAKLYPYLPARTYACRTCLGLVYRVQYRKGWRDAFFRRIWKWRDSSPAYRRRWCKRFECALVSGRLSWPQAWAIIEFQGDLPRENHNPKGNHD
jgi:hypothetical protein